MRVTASCNATLSASTVSINGGASSRTICDDVHTDTAEHQCASCAITASWSHGENQVAEPWESPANIFIGQHPEVLCAEYPAAVQGDSCGADKPCFPTHATLASNGSWEQTYLECAGTCQPYGGPTVTNYLTPCTNVDLVGRDDLRTSGVVMSKEVGFEARGQACMLAWDQTAQVLVSARTNTCIGDWQCPSGSACDDQLTELDSPTARYAVCKPGARGTLTADMIAQ